MEATLLPFPFPALSKNIAGNWKSQRKQNISTVASEDLDQWPRQKRERLVAEALDGLDGLAQRPDGELFVIWVLIPTPLKTHCASVLILIRSSISTNFAWTSFNQSFLLRLRCLHNGRYLLERSFYPCSIFLGR